jgi:hypothetical protein
VFAKYPRDFSIPLRAFAKFTSVFFMFRKAEGSFAALFRSNGLRRSFPAGYVYFAGSHLVRMWGAGHRLPLRATGRVGVFTAQGIVALLV